MKWSRRLWLAFSAAIAIGFVAVLFLGKLFFSRPQPSPHAAGTSSVVPPPEVTKLKVHLYFATASCRYLTTEERQLKAFDTLAALEAIVTELLKGPEDSKLASTVPSGTQLLHSFVTDDGTAYVDLSSELSRLHPGGFIAERLTLYAIVNSIVLNLDEVERVQLLLEGKPANTLAGHLDIRHPKTADLLIAR